MKNLAASTSHNREQKTNPPEKPLVAFLGKDLSGQVISEGHTSFEKLRLCVGELFNASRDGFASDKLPRSNRVLPVGAG